jgi:predicted acyltransferase
MLLATDGITTSGSNGDKTMTVISKPSITFAPTSTSAKPDRLLSLDLLRGLTIGFMILVNNNGDGSRAYWALKHADWNGFTPTDLVFPTFLFLVGISTVLSTAQRLARGATRQSLFLHTLRRAVILFLLGIVVNSFPLFHLHTMRFYGVLPRIAICYLIVATLYIFRSEWRSKAALAVAALIGYWLLMRFVTVPGYGTPTHEIPLLDRDANLAAWLDRQIFSASHLYERTRDPEGLLSTIPALATTIMGLLTGVWLRTSRTLGQKARAIAVAGLSCVLLGGLWNFSFPINKKLWTSSYVLFAGGLSLLLLALAIWIVDVRSAKKSPSDVSRGAGPFTPLLVFGTNAITAYVFSELLASVLDYIHTSPGVNLEQTLYRSILGVIPDPAFSSLLYSLGYVLVCWLAVYPLYRQKIFIKI